MKMRSLTTIAGLLNKKLLMKRTFPATIALVAMISSNAFALAKADLINCQLEIEREIDAHTTKFGILGKIYSEIDSRHQTDLNAYKNRMYFIGYGGSLTSISMLPDTTVGVQVSDSDYKDVKTLITLDLTDLIQQLRSGATEYTAIKSSKKVSIGSNETVFIRCAGVNSRSAMLKTINDTQSFLNSRLLKQIWK